jgi:hypothetical protein
MSTLSSRGSLLLRASQAWRAVQQCWRDGAWQRLNETEALHRQETLYGFFKPPPPSWDNYSWVPVLRGDCVAQPYPEFDRAHFCRLLGGEDVLLVGDSLSRQFLISLKNLGMAPSRFSPPQTVPLPYVAPVVSSFSVCEDSRLVQRCCSTLRRGT